MHIYLKRIILASYFIIPFCVYLYTLHPTVSPYRDSGDLITAASTLGLAHPPGYPLYALAGKAFTAIFKLGNTAYRMNVMSAFFAAAGLFLLALAIIGLFDGAMFAGIAVIFLAFSTSYWRLAQVSEMYSLNAFLAALILYLAAKQYGCPQAENRKQEALSLYAISFICGLACANHPTIIFIAPPLVWLALSSKNLKPVNCLSAVIFFCIGLSAYLFLPLRSVTDPVSSWGKPDTLTSFFRMVTRSDYGGLRLHPEESKFSWDVPVVLSHLWVYLKSLVDQFTVIGALLGLWGMFIKRNEKYFQFLIGSLVIAGPIFVIFSNLPPAEKTTLPILEPHLVFPNVIFALFIAAGINKFSKYGFIPKALILCSAAALLFIKLPLCSYRNHFYAYDYGKNLFKTTPAGSVIYDPDDPTAFITTYNQAVMGLRPDVKLAAYFRTRWGYELLKRRHPDILPNRDIASGQELARVLLDYNRARLPVFAELPSKFPQGYLAFPIGLLYRLSTQNEFVPPSGGLFEFYSAHNELSDKPEYDFFTRQVISYYAAAHNNIGLSFSSLKWNDEARMQYYLALSINPELEAAVNNVGTLEFSIKNYSEAEQRFQRVLELNNQSPSVLYNIATTYRAMKNNRAAEEFLERAWQDFGYADAGNEIGLMSLESGNAEQAERMFKSVLGRHSGYSLAYFNLGLAQKKLGRYEEARRSFEAYLSMTQDSTDRKETMAIINSLPKK
jgi:tetratricopeptide (TPR) repeat protein